MVKRIGKIARAAAVAFMACVFTLTLLATSNADLYADADTWGWADDYIRYVISEGLMGSTDEDELIFNAGGAVTREMFITVLYRFADEPAAIGLCSFTDADPDAYYYTALRWAQQHGIARGRGDGTFGVGDTITRAEAAAFLYRYGDFTGYDINLGNVATLDMFTDAEGIAEWAVEPLSWACSHGLMIGVGGGKIDPNGGLTRAQLATLIYRLDDIFVDY